MAQPGAFGIQGELRVAFHLQLYLLCCDRSRVCHLTRACLLAKLYCSDAKSFPNQEFRDELVRVALRRDRCASLASQDLCKGSCLWDAAGMKCNLQPLEALLAVIDEDCPLRQGHRDLNIKQAVTWKVVACQECPECRVCLSAPHDSVVLAEQSSPGELIQEECASWLLIW